MGNRIAVIGANSFSGRAFVKHGGDSGDYVIEISRPAFDLSEPDDIADWILQERASHVVNFAALNMVAESWAHPVDYYRANLVYVVKLCDRLQEFGWSGRWIQVSTPEVYGAQGGLISEGAPFRPSTPYAVSRAAIDMHLKALHAAHGFRVLFTRSCNVYGPGQQVYRLIPKTILTILRGEKLKLHGGGLSRRAWIHVDDAASGIRSVALQGHDGGDYHVSTGAYMSIRTLVGIIAVTMGRRSEEVIELVPERPGKDMDYELGDAKIRAELGWSDRVSISDGLAETVAWFRENAEQFEGRTLEYWHQA